MSATSNSNQRANALRSLGDKTAHSLPWLPFMGAGAITLRKTPAFDYPIASPELTPAPAAEISRKP